MGETFAVLYETPVDRLQKWGFAGLIERKGPIDAVRQYQTAMGLMPDGIIGKLTADAMNGDIILPRINEEEVKCQCALRHPYASHCDGYPKGKGIGAGILLLAKRIFREVEKAYPGTEFFCVRRCP